MFSLNDVSENCEFEMDLYNTLTFLVGSKSTNLYQLPLVVILR